MHCDWIGMVTWFDCDCECDWSGWVGECIGVVLRSTVVSGGGVKGNPKRWLSATEYQADGCFSLQELV